MRSIIILLFVQCLVFSPSGHAREGEFEPTPADVYRGQGVTVVLPDAWEPFSFVDEAGKRTGFLVDLWTAWGKRAGTETRLVYLDDEAARAAMASNATEIHGGLRSSDEWAKVLDYADSVHSSNSVLAIRVNGEVDCSTAMADGTIGLVDYADTLGQADARYPYAKRVVYPEAKSAVDALLAGEVDGVVAGYPQLAEVDKETPVLAGLDICRTLFYHEVYAGVQQGQTELLELVNTGLSNIPSEEFKAIKSRWFLMAERPKPDVLEAILPAAFALMLVVGVTVLWVKRRR